MHITDLGISIARLRQQIDNGYIREIDFDGYTIYNYGPKTQYQGVWTTETMQCRGLITTSLGDVLALPFRKFFNLNETDETRLENLPDEEPEEVLMKLDGMLGILWWRGDEPRIATRGNLYSEHAEWATKWLQEKLRTENLPRDITLIFEIIYPGSRIVLDYSYER